MARLLKTFRNIWCDLMHNQPTWPVSGKYYCRKCWRLYVVPWENAPRIDVLVLPLAAKTEYARIHS
jgi:hypothetical protein